MKKILMVIVAVIIAAGLAVGGFYGGMAYQKNQSSQVQANFFNQRGSGPNGAGPSVDTYGAIPQGGQFPSNGVFQGRNGQGGFGGVTGQIKDIQGSVLTLSTAENVTTVNLTDTTLFEQMGEASLSDLKPGQRVSINGERDSAGNLTAVRITIIPDSVAPVATGTAP